MSSDFRSLRGDRDREIQSLAAATPIRSCIRAGNKQLISDSLVTQSPRPRLINASISETGKLDEIELRKTLAPLLQSQSDQKFYSAIAAFDSNHQLKFIAEAPAGPDDEMTLRTRNFLPYQIRPDENVWTINGRAPLCSIINQPIVGSTLRCSVPIFPLEDQPQSHGALVADVRLDATVAAIARRSESPDQTDRKPLTIVMAVDESGGIVYHTNQILNHQPAKTWTPHFAPIADSMVAGQEGAVFYNGAESNSWLIVYAPLVPKHLSLAAATNYSSAAKTTGRNGWLTILLALLVGIVATVFLSNYYLRQTQSIDVVKQGVGAIVQGKLDHEIALRSSDNLRSLADNVGLITKQMRDQLAHEAETRQFQSFIRLSAILTHDLKNSIEALSLTVSNMERHFENPEFRADAMKTLRGATQNLKALVERLSNPVSTLSGEHKRPQPVDLVPMMRKVISMTAAQVGEGHETKITLPESLYVLADAERLEKVIENLIINALEAMAGKKGTLTIEAGESSDKKAFFSVSDTGNGMSQRFIEEKLFHPFATTKSRGVGLGLYTCREVVRAHGGTIEVDSGQGVGTAFRVVLPSAEIDRGNDNSPHPSK